MANRNPFFDGSIIVASDADAQYELLETHLTKDGTLTCLTCRHGKSESGFSLREVRLEDFAQRYVGEGDSLLQLAENISFRERRKQIEERNFIVALEHSISDVIAKSAVSVFKEMKLQERPNDRT